MSGVSSSRVLKADDARMLGARVAFNFDDIQSRCDDYLNKVKEQARQILAEAHQEAAETRHRAEEQGRELGRQHGLVDADVQIEERARDRAEREVHRRLKTVLPALEAAARAVASERENWLSEWETAAIRLAVAIAARILRQTLDDDPKIAVGMIHDALQMAAGSTRLKLRLHPEDVQLLGDNAAEVVAALASCGEPSIVADPTVERGGSVVETQQGTIDARLETQLSRITQELLQKN